MTHTQCATNTQANTETQIQFRIYLPIYGDMYLTDICDVQRERESERYVYVSLMGHCGLAKYMSNIISCGVAHD